MFRSRLTLCALALGCATGCVFPRGSTPLLSVMQSPVDRATQPEDLWQLTVVSADVPHLKRTGTSWDDDGGKPDPYVLLRIKGVERWRSSSSDDTFEPGFSQPPTNFVFARDARLRFELWDDDGVGSDPIGIYEGRVFAESVIGSDTTIKLDSGANLTLRLDKPVPKQGLGLSEYELRPSAVLILAVVPNSPAARAKLKPGDRIIAIDGKPLNKFEQQEAESALALASQHKSKLLVARDKREFTVTLDNGYIWPAM
jgi:hypothetical protein